MRYSVTRLCGGKAMMVSPKDDVPVDINEAARILASGGEIKEKDEMMLVMSWKGMDVTVYSNGKIMFHPLEDRNSAISCADELLSRLHLYSMR